MRIVFMGTPDFAVPALKGLCASPIEVAAVFTQPDRPAGRGRRMAPPAVKGAAIEWGLEVRQPERVRAADIALFKPDLVAVVAFGQILSRRVLALPSLGVLNLHASLLPRWRGASPIQRALLAGDQECGVSVMRVVPALDAGPVLACRSLPIGLRDTAEELHDRLATAGALLLVETLLRLEGGEIEEDPQDEDGASYAEKLTKEEAPLDWGLSAEVLDRQVRGLRPWPVAQTRWPGVEEGPVRIWRALPLPSQEGGEGGPGALIGLSDSPEGRGIRVRAGEGDLLLLEVQPPGKRRKKAEDFWRGRPSPTGSRLGDGP